ncbi:MAG: hypothetical protein WCD57_20840 [Acidobacteriaceae bacterium]
MAWLLILIVSALSTIAHAQSFPEDATAGILAAFRKYPIVAIGESHGYKEAGEFYESLIGNKTFEDSVNDIVIEFASRQSQTVLDKYVNGENVSQQELENIWRNTTKVFAWESPIYAHLLERVREVNAELPRGKRLRVLAGDSWIDWAKTSNYQEWASHQPNDRSFARVINQEVLEKGQKALVILGSAHVAKNTDSNLEPNTTTRVEQGHPRSIYVVLMTVLKPPYPVSIMPPVLLAWPKLTLPNGTKALVGKYGDAQLYLGSSLEGSEPNWEHYKNDIQYQNELNRRARIRWGCDFDLQRFQEGLPICH